MTLAVIVFLWCDHAHSAPSKITSSILNGDSDFNLYDNEHSKNNVPDTDNEYENGDSFKSVSDKRQLPSISVNQDLFAIAGLLRAQSQRRQQKQLAGIRAKLTDLGKRSQIGMGTGDDETNLNSNHEKESYRKILRSYIEKVLNAEEDPLRALQTLLNARTWLNKLTLSRHIPVKRSSDDLDSLIGASSERDILDAIGVLDDFSGSFRRQHPGHTPEKKSSPHLSPISPIRNIGTSFELTQARQRYNPRTMRRLTRLGKRSLRMSSARRSDIATNK